MKYAPALEESANADDTIIECGGVSIVVDLPSVSMPQGMTVDFLDSMEASGFGDPGGRQMINSDLHPCIAWC